MPLDPEVASAKIMDLSYRMGRLVADAESEKATRARTNDSIQKQFEQVSKRLTVLERSMWFACGAVTALQIVNWFVH